MNEHKLLLEHVEELEKEAAQLRLTLRKYEPTAPRWPSHLVWPQPWEPPVTTVTITDVGSDKPPLWREVEG